MPQGGIDDGEDEVEAAYRELLEETGVQRSDVRFIQKTAEWLTYDLPLEVIPNRWVRLELTALDDVIDLTHKDVEFSAWRWMAAQDLLHIIVPFKHDIYRSVFTEFSMV